MPAGTIEQDIQQVLAAQRELVRRQAERRFGWAVAAEFARRLEGLIGPAGPAEVRVPSTAAPATI